MMKQVRWISGGCLTTMGVSWLLLFALVAVDAVIDPDEDEEAASWPELVAAGIVFGVPPLAGGSVLLWAAIRDRNRIYDQHLRETFHDLLRQNEGRITALEFSLQAEITGTVAKEFLDARAREFNADFRVGEAGGIAYYFDLSDAILEDYRSIALDVNAIEPQDAPREARPERDAADP